MRDEKKAQKARSKGGRNRATNLTADERSAIAKKGGVALKKKFGSKYMAKLGSKGANQRNASLTPAERSAIAKRAVDAREAKKKRQLESNPVDLRPGNKSS